jgi:hypothetical protein
MNPEAEQPRPNVAIRRWGDACFHAVDEVVPEGYIIDGVLIAKEDVLEVRPITGDEGLKPRVRHLKPPPDATADN